MNSNKYVLITSLKTNLLKVRFRCVINIIFNSILLFFFCMFFNKEQIKKFANKIWEIYTYRTPKNYGHPSVNKSLIRGLKKLKIPFVINKITSKTENVIVLWTTKDDFEILAKLKREGKIKKLIISPVYAYPESEVYSLVANSKDVDILLVASEWAKKECIQKINDPKLHNRVVPWPSGVELVRVEKGIEVQNSCICYFKQSPVNNEILKICNSFGIKTFIIEYSNYRFSEYIDKLKKSDFVIFFQSCVETQGLAIAEAWAQNKPTLLNYNTNDFGGTTSPYLTKMTGLYYKNMEELINLLTEYKQNPKVFLNQFTPRQWVEQNLSDEVTVKGLLELIDNIKTNS